MHGEAATAQPHRSPSSGDTIDFVVDCRADVDYDTFNWPVTLRLTPSDERAAQVWDSTSGFHGPLRSPPLTRWEELAQVLLMSNEFMFVD